MGSYLGVAACSEEPPKFIHLTYKGAGEIKRRVALVGKGLTFDSGGYEIALKINIYICNNYKVIYNIYSPTLFQ